MLEKQAAPSFREEVSLKPSNNHMIQHRNTLGSSQSFLLDLARQVTEAGRMQRRRAKMGVHPKNFWLIIVSYFILNFTTPIDFLLLKYFTGTTSLELYHFDFT